MYQKGDFGKVQIELKELKKLLEKLVEEIEKKLEIDY